MIKALIGKSVTTGLVFALMGSTSALAQSGGWRLSETNGQVSVGRQGVTKTAIGGQNLRAGDVIRTGSRSRAVVTRGDQYMVVAANSHIKLANPETDGVMTQVFNYLGNVLFKVDKRKAKHFGVETPYMAAVVKGTTFNVTVGAEGSTVQVTEGAVEVATLDGGAVELLRPGMIGMVSGADPFAMTIMGDGTRRIESPNRVNAVTKTAKIRTIGSKSAIRETSAATPATISKTISNQPVQLAAITNGLIEGNSPGSSVASFEPQSAEADGQQDVFLATENVVSQVLENTALNSGSGGGNDSSNGQGAANGGGNGNASAGDDGNNGGGNDPSGQDPSNPGQGNDGGNSNGSSNGQGANNSGGDENADAGDDGNNGGGNDPSGQDPSNPGQGNGNGGGNGNGSSNGQGANYSGGNESAGAGDDGNNGGGNDPSGQDPSNPGQGNGQSADNDDGNENSGDGNSNNSEPNYGGDQPDGTCNGVPNCRSGANPNGDGSSNENAGAGDDVNNGGGNDPSNPGQGHGNSGGNDNGSNNSQDPSNADQGNGNAEAAGESNKSGRQRYNWRQRLKWLGEQIKERYFSQ